MGENWNIVFCDVDDIAGDFFANTELVKKYKCEFLTRSLNDISPEELGKFSDANVISTFVYSRLTADILQRFKNLKLVCTRSTGYNNVDLDYCMSKNIKVANVIGYGAITVAEYAMGFLLNLTRNISFSNNKLRRGVVDVDEDMGIDVSGKTIGVIGTGAIGKHFVELCQPFDCQVLILSKIRIWSRRICVSMSISVLCLGSQMLSAYIALQLQRITT